jgi:ribosome-associated toxin RatA of RatAB toxin-antitoxin module
VSARRRLPAGLLGAALALAAAAAVGAPAPSPSPDERQRLAQGAIVYRVGAAPRDGTVVPGARGAVAFVRVPTAPDPIWAILTEPARYPEIFPGLRAVEVLESSERAWLVKTEGQFGPFSFRYFTRYRLEPAARTITWRLDTTRDNDAFDDNWGWWQLVPEDGGTLVVYAIGSVASSWQPLAGFFERRGITQALAALRDAAVRRGRATGAGASG